LTAEKDSFRLLGSDKKFSSLEDKFFIAALAEKTR